MIKITLKYFYFSKKKNLKIYIYIYIYIILKPLKVQFEIVFKRLDFIVLQQLQWEVNWLFAMVTKESRTKKVL